MASRSQLSRCTTIVNVVHLGAREGGIRIALLQPVPASVLDKNTRLIDVHTSDFGKYCMNVVGVNFAALCIELVNAAFNSEN